ncbi:MAG: FAD-binding oxidoreductase [Woeseiaceae bacterium]|nr:FAD-binding oxidoreductase [Woeseiaceae bacterium]
MNDLSETLKSIVGDGHWATDAARLEPHVTEWRGVHRGRARMLLMPDSADQVAAIVRACAAARVAIVPQGGNTGTCAGAIPDDSGEQVIVNLRRMNRIRSVDADDFSLVAEAGCVLADLQRAAAEAGRLLPLSHGGEGSSQIGGNLSTNAGGINVLRYGTARSLVLGVEAVLADGTIWDGIRTLRKDTAGYDLKQLFIGSEGTLGVITAVALKLFPLPGEMSTALVALRQAADAVRLLGRCRELLGDRIQAFELISARAFDYVVRHLPGARLPFDTPHPWYVLTDVASGGDADTLQSALNDAADMIDDAVVAKNISEAESLWRMRHAIPESEKREGPGAKHDISVPVGRINAFLDAADSALRKRYPLLEPVIFGHVGDGNLHYNVMLPAEPGDDAQEQLKHEVSTLVYDVVTRFGGSISAEHGIGLAKKAFLARYRGDVELGLMRTLKNALDPLGILNPGKVI